MKTREYHNKSLPTAATGYVKKKKKNDNNKKY